MQGNLSLKNISTGHSNKIEGNFPKDLKLNRSKIHYNCTKICLTYSSEIFQCLAYINCKTKISHDPPYPPPPPLPPVHKMSNNDSAALRNHFKHSRFFCRRMGIYFDKIPILRLTMKNETCKYFAYYGT